MRCRFQGFTKKSVQTMSPTEDDEKKEEKKKKEKKKRTKKNPYR
jgi:hypothetical protein